MNFLLSALDFTGALIGILVIKKNPCKQIFVSKMKKRDKGKQRRGKQKKIQLEASYASRVVLPGQLHLADGGGRGRHVQQHMVSWATDLFSADFLNLNLSNLFEQVS